MKVNCQRVQTEQTTTPPSTSYTIASPHHHLHTLHQLPPHSYKNRQKNGNNSNSPVNPPPQQWPSNPPSKTNRALNPPPKRPRQSHLPPPNPTRDLTPPLHNQRQRLGLDARKPRQFRLRNARCTTTTSPTPTPHTSPLPFPFPFPSLPNLQQIVCNSTNSTTTALQPNPTLKHTPLHPALIPGFRNPAGESAGAEDGPRGLRRQQRFVFRRG